MDIELTMMSDFATLLDINGKPKLFPEEQIFVLVDNASIEIE